MDSAITSFVVHDPGARLPPLDPDGLMPLFAAAAQSGRPATRSACTAPNPWAMAHYADLAISPQWLDFPDPLRPPARRRSLPSRATTVLACAVLGAGLLIGAGHAAGLLPPSAAWHPAETHVRSMPLPAAPSLTVREQPVPLPVAPFTLVDATRAAVFDFEEPPRVPDSSTAELARLSTPQDAESCRATPQIASAPAKVDVEPTAARVETARPQTARSQGKIKHKHRPARPLPVHKRRS